MVLVNLLDFALLITGWIVIIAFLPDDFKEELGGCVGTLILIIWFVVWLILFCFLGYDVQIVRS